VQEQTVWCSAGQIRQHKSPWGAVSTGRFAHTRPSNTDLYCVVWIIVIVIILV